MRGLFPRAFRLTAVAAVVLFAACTASNTLSVPAPPTSAATPAAAAPVEPTQPAASVEPTPLAAWQLDGNGDGSPGDPLTFVGAHEYDHGAVVLDGVTGYGATAGAGPLDTTASYTVAAWVTVSAKSPFGTVISQIGETAAAFYLGVSAGVWAFTIKDQDTNTGEHTFRAMATPPVIDPAVWVHVAGVFDEQGGKVLLYLDGERVAETSFNAPWQAHGPMIVGGSKARGALSDFWPGAIDAATVYQAALTDDEIERLRDASRPTAIPPVLAAPSADPALDALRGTWDYPVTDADPRELSQESADAAREAGKPGAEVTLRFGFDRGRWWLGFVLDGELWLLHGVPEGDLGTMTVDGDKVTMTNGRDGWMTYRWSIDGDRLTLAMVDCVNQARSGECPDRDVVDLITSHTFARSGTDPTY